MQLSHPLISGAIYARYENDISVQFDQLDDADN